MNGSLTPACGSRGRKTLPDLHDLKRRLGLTSTFCFLATTLELPQWVVGMSSGEQDFHYQQPLLESGC